jgi:hypothetical protein
MTDAERATKNVTLQRRAVIRSSVDRLYYVYEWSGFQWERAGRGYSHSTSAYAHLGRLVNEESQKDLLGRK